MAPPCYCRCSPACADEARAPSCRLESTFASHTSERTGTDHLADGGILRLDTAAERARRPDVGARRPPCNSGNLELADRGGCQGDADLTWRGSSKCHERSQPP